PALRPVVPSAPRQEGPRVITQNNPQAAPQFNSGFAATNHFPPRFHPSLPAQSTLSLWTFNGTLPPKLIMARYGEPILFRHHNKLPFDVTQNGGFGRHTISTHEHNGHHGARDDGFTGAVFFPGHVSHHP